jgi:RND family efflux transporter MFP subunit
MKIGRIGSGALAFAALSLAACSGQDAGKAPAPVATGPRLTVAAVDAPDWQSVSAEIATRDEAQVTARIPGVLSTLAVHAGDAIHRGQVIGRVTDDQLAYQAGAYGAQTRAAAAQAAAAEAELDRVRFLASNGVYAKARLEQAEAAAHAARAATEAASAQQGAARAVAANGVVIAPADGRVLRADIPAGTPVAPGSVIAVVTAGPVLVRLDLPEALATKIQVGAPVRVDGVAGEGRVERVYPAVDAGQVRADVAMPALDARLIGRRLAARVTAGTMRALMVPRQYVTTRFGIDYATLVAPGGSAIDVPVQTAPGDDAHVVILSGIKPGDTLVPPAQGARP